jgi:hypothetical protein
MISEKKYAFRQRIDTIHLPNRYDPRAVPEQNEAVVENGWQIVIPADASEYLTRVARDLQDYLFRSMNVSTLLVRHDSTVVNAGSSGGAIVLTNCDADPDRSEGLSVPRSYRLRVAPDRILVCGYDEMGCGQACYHIEDLMNLREAPYLTKGEVVREPLFAPRMVHSGWGIDQFPSAHLNAIAHAGFDTVLVFVKGPNHTTTGHLDINDLIARAAGFRLNVYLYSYLISGQHPENPGAEAYYDATYGELMRAHPGAKGIIFVGEACEFPSKDKNTTQRLRSDRLPADTKPSPGWWPCYDYPDWLNMVKTIIRREIPDADIVFWTYNWGWCPEEERLRLIRSLPDDVSVQATFEMFEDVERNGVPTRCVDYTASFAGPGKYFASEAKTAHESKLRLYTMANTGGQTWDFGVIPYEPVPFQWARRHEALLNANSEWGLRGLMESHHMGWWPSIIADLAKWAFWKPTTSAEEIIPRLARRDFGGAAAGDVVKAWRHWSEAILNYVPTNEDQYGPFRVGPSYPLLLSDDEIEFPSADFAHFGSRILTTNYQPHDPSIIDGEIACLNAMAAGWERGVELMKRAVDLTTESKRENGMRMAVLGEFILRCVWTTVHVKQWWKLRQELRAVGDESERTEVVTRMRILAEAEILNAEETIPLVDYDSRLGWEPSMEYMTDRAHLEWKIAQVRHVLDVEIPAKIQHV